MAPLIDPQQIEAVAGVPEEIDLLSWVTDDRDGELTFVPDSVSEKQAQWSTSAKDGWPTRLHEASMAPTHSSSR